VFFAGPVLRLILDDADKFAIAASTLPSDQLLSVAQCEGAIKGLRIQSMVSNSVRRPERAAVCVEYPNAPRPEMVGCRVAFVAIESVARVAAVELEHLTIARTFAAIDAAASPSIGDRRAHAALRHRDFGYANASTSTTSGSGTSARMATLHPRAATLMDVDAIDFSRIGGRDATHRVLQDAVVEAFALGGSTSLESTRRRCAVRMKDDGGRDDRARPAARPTSSTPATCTNPTRRTRSRACAWRDASHWADAQERQDGARPAYFVVPSFMRGLGP